MVTSGEGWKEGIIREPGMDTYTLLYLKWITSKVLLYSTWNYIQCPEINHSGNAYERECVCVCVYIYIYMYVCITESFCFTVDINTLIKFKKKLNPLLT